MLGLDKILLENVTVRGLLDMIDSKRKDNSEVKLHPNGFLQLQLNSSEWRGEGFRFHVWASDVPIQKDPKYQIHNHQFDIESYVLCGTLINTLYDITPDELGEFTLIEAGIESLTDIKKRVSSKIRKTQHIFEGNSYTLAGKEFHTSHTESPIAITLMSKLNIYNSKKPYVVFPINYSEDKTIISRFVDQKFAWRIIDSAEDEILRRYT